MCRFFRVLNLGGECGLVVFVNLQSTQDRARSENPEREHEEILRRKGIRCWKLRAGNPEWERKGMLTVKSGECLEGRPGKTGRKELVVFIIKRRELWEQRA